MILGHPRHRLIFIALAGMDAAWFAPFWLLLWQQAASGPPFPGLPEPARHAALFLGLWGGLLAYMLAADLLNRSSLPSPWRDLVLLGGMGLATLASIRLLLYPLAPPLDFAWLRHTGVAIFGFARRLRPELALVVANFFLWLRVAMASGRELSFFSVGVSFRLGMLLAILGNGLLTAWTPTSTGVALQGFVLFWALGLAAVALARMEEKALAAGQSRGSGPSWSQLWPLPVAIALVLATALALTRLYTPARLGAFLGWFAPVWEALRWILLRLLWLLFVLLSPALEGLVAYLRGLMGELPALEPVGETTFGPENAPTLGQLVEAWNWLGYCLAAGILLLAFALVWLFFMRIQREAPAEDEEEMAAEELSFSPGRLGEGLARLQAWWRLLRRFGLGSGLLAALSVQNIYANLTRLARRRGYPRRPAQSPDDYLPTLCQAFPGHQERLARITAAYMQVHYGDIPIDPDHLAQLRHDYTQITTPSPQAPNHQAP
ncbi:DUF4129 domain-containing protein [Litorilinea aerophila]|uniref:DUF4129 domain-containing protein n=1 Tax=Litorilinea aerophila TaxID=1204385 RepID=A0A540VKW8_9CHLR|nr:DUF4129 domain-containing protein [Litorilinea aerophila]MCC9075623.1 DUF4129 domain-containing protein [Litorilinea aerophila]